MFVIEGGKMGENVISNEKHNTQRKAEPKYDVEGLMKRANEVGIVNIVAYGGVSGRILSDAIEATEFVKQYFVEHVEHPEE